MRREEEQENQRCVVLSRSGGRLCSAGRHREVPYLPAVRLEAGRKGVPLAACQCGSLRAICTRRLSVRLEGETESHSPPAGAARRELYALAAFQCGSPCLSRQCSSVSAKGGPHSATVAR